MAEEGELVSIKPAAFLNLVLHAFRFWSEDPSSRNEIVYGLLLGYIEGQERFVRKVVPILHQDKPNLTMDDQFMKKVGEVNRFELENQSTDEVIGWYRSSLDGIKFLAKDIKNHIPFQKHDPNFIALILDPKLYIDPDEGGFSIFRLKGDNYYNMMTDYYKIPWQIETLEEPTAILGQFQGYIKRYFLNKPLITELDE